MAYLEVYIGIIPGQKGSERFAEPQNRTSKPNLEPTEPQKTERTSEPNQVHPTLEDTFFIV